MQEKYSLTIDGSETVHQQEDSKLAKKSPHPKIVAPDPNEPHPIEKASILAKYFATWTRPFTDTCAKQDWQQEMHPRLPKSDQVEGVADRISKNFSKSGKSLFKTIIVTFRPELIEFTIFAVLYSVFRFSTSVFIKSIIGLINEDVRKDGVLRKLIFGFTAVALMNLVKPIVFQYYYFKASRLSFSVRSALISMINSKIMRTNLKAIDHGGEFSEGNVANLVQVDIRRLMRFFVQIFLVLYNFVSLIIGLIFLSFYVPYSLIFVSLGFLIVVYSVYQIAFYLIRRFFKKLLEAKDSRMSLLKNVLKNLEYVKVAALENFFSLKIAEKREEEIKYLNRYALTTSFARLLVYFARDFLYFVIILYFIIVGKDSEDASYGTYVVLFKLISSVQVNLYTGMGSIIYLVRMRVSITRLSNFLALDDLKVEKDEEEEDNHPSQGEVREGEQDVVLEIENGRFCWWASENKETEKDLEKKNKKEDQRSAKGLGPRLERRIRQIEERNKTGDFHVESRQSLLTAQETSSVVSTESKLAPLSVSRGVDGNQEGEHELHKSQSKREQRVAFELKDVSLKIKKGEKVFIFGDSSSGKSSLLYAILGEMSELEEKSTQDQRFEEKLHPAFAQETQQLKESKKIAESSIKLKRGRFGFVSQQRWIIGDSIKNNIILALNYDDERMRKCLENSQLIDDLPQFSDGVDSILGDTSDNISGGQKARISLARCFYQK